MSAGGRRARGELSRRLRAQMVRVGLSHAELATAADLSVIVIDDALNPAKAPPSAGALNRLAAALGITDPALTQWGVLRDRSAPRNRQDSPHLLGYLRAARRAVCDHPYPGAVPGTAPPLPTVYVTQSANPHRTHGSTSPLHPATGPVAAEAILRQGRNCVVLAGPGCGKSILLRAGLVAMADRWLAGRADTAVPVLVPAIHLTSENVALSEALAAKVSAELSLTGLSDPLPADFFRLEPQPGVPWLLLVDGLDEIVDTAARLRVLDTLKANADDSYSPYRFVITAQSLTPTESFTLARTPIYRLQPFTPTDLPRFAVRWFTVLGLPDPDNSALSFTAALEHAHLTELARTPLVATMLCQLYAMTPDRQLPTGRSTIYLRFTELLHERHRSTGIGIQTRTALQRHGDHAVTRAQHTLDRLHPLLADLAVQRRTGNTEPTLDLLAAQPDAACPEHVPLQLWAQFLSENLQRSGLMTVRADDFSFLHQTFLDYFAAGQIAADPAASTREFSDLFDDRWTEDRFGPGPAWTPPDDDSFLGFLLDAWSGTPTDPAEALQRIAGHGGPGCEFIIAQARLGTLLSASLVAAATDALASWAETPTESGSWLASFRREAAEVLAAIGDPRGPHLLTAMTSDPALHNGFWAGRSLAELGDPRGRDILATMATTDPDFDDRLSTMRALAELGDARGPDLMAGMTANIFLDAPLRSRAAEALVELGDPRGPTALAAMATDTRLDGPWRRRAAEALATSGDPRGPHVLAAMATNTRLDSSWRRRAAEALARLGDPRGPATLAAMTAESGLDEPAQRRAAEALAAFGDPRGPDILAAIAANLDLDSPWRRRAAEALVELGDPRDSAIDLNVNSTQRKQKPTA